MPEEDLTQEVDETTADSSAETNENDTTQDVAEDKKDEVKVPFHEDPKIQDYISRQVETRFESERSKIEQDIAQRLSSKEEVKVPTWFGGGSTEPENVSAYREFLEGQEQLVSQAEQRAIDWMKKESETEKKAVEEANSWFETSVKELEADGKKIDRNKLLKKAMDEELIDSKGRWAYKQAQKLLEAEERLAATPSEDAVNEKKRTAAATTSESKAESKQREYATPDDFRGGKKPW